MFVAFDSLDDSSRLWMYGSETEFTEQQSDYITKKLTFFLENWEYHKNKLTASFNILENRFIIIALDDSIHAVGGCSLDGLQRLIQTFEKELSITLMNRLNVFCKILEVIKVIPSFKLGIIANKDTLFYDLTIQRKEELSNYLKPIKNGWAKSYL